MSDFIIDDTAAFLRRTLDGAAARQRVIAGNIANTDTPNYTRKELNFEDALSGAMDSAPDDPAARIAAIEAVVLEPTEDLASPRRADGNNVNIEREMVEMAKNTGQYERAAQLLSMKISALRSAIFEGKK